MREKDTGSGRPWGCILRDQNFSKREENSGGDSLFSFRPGGIPGDVRGVCALQEHENLAISWSF